MKLVYLFFAFIHHIKTLFRIKVFQKRFFLLNKTGKEFRTKRQEEKLLVVVAHVVPNAVNAHVEKLQRVTACLEALGKSLAAFESKIILLTKENYSLHECLPDYLKKRTEVYFSQQEDPMFVEFDAYDVFLENREKYDYFLFLEDDILLTDSWFLEKIKKFNYYSPYKNYVLTPHRFEYFKGIKLYFDQHITKENIVTTYKYSEKLKVNFEGVAFTIFQNPHSAFYCLNREQLDLWKRSGYKWKNKIVAIGKLESAATFSLYENFEFLKPHPDNTTYFEVQHFGNKYILHHNMCD